MNKLNIYIRSYNELNKRELFDIYFLRQEVFIVEQNCVYQDIDQKDQYSYHLMAYDNEILVAYLRIVHPGISYDEPSIGRVLTKIDYRGRGIAKNIMQSAIQKVRDVYKHSNIRISAQEYLIPFYTSLNFESIGEVYLEDDIPHIEMMHKD
tara:strand:- start:167 stop:619 length:453 start_codon:yes stop_codon:yes gene_type:complete